MNDARTHLLERFAATGRNHPYLALTVNSICDLDCVFCKPRCMPDYGNAPTALTAADYAAIASEAGRWRIAKAHISGGEPTLRRDICALLRGLRDGLGPSAHIGITTHGNLRAGLSVAALATSGCTGVNVSLHSLDPERSARIMGGGEPSRALHTIRGALDLGLLVKVNCVAMRSTVEDVRAVTELARDLPIAIRVIELQRIGPAAELFPHEFISEAELRAMDGPWNARTEVSRRSLGVRSPGRYVRPEGGAGSIAFISNSSCARCSDANRIKITPTGMARPCVLDNRDVELHPRFGRDNLARAFAHLFESILGRDRNPSFSGFHFIDYDLRWDRARAESDAALIPASCLAPRKLQSAGEP